MNTKHLITILTLLGILLICIAFSILLQNTYNIQKELIKYLRNKGFKLDTASLYIKEDSEYPLSMCDENTKEIECMGEAIYFDIDEYELIKNKNLKQNKMIFSLVAIYSYQDDTLSYTYRITYENGVLILKGNYLMKQNKYTCNKDYAYGINLIDYQDLCNDFENDLTEFYYQTKTIISNDQILNNLKKSK